MSLQIHFFTLQQQQAQSKLVKLPQNCSSIIVRRVNNAMLVSSAMTDAVVFFALLLALAIVICVLLLEKRPGHNMVNVETYAKVIQVKDEQEGKSHAVFMQDENFHISHRLFLPSTTINEPVQSEESTTISDLPGRPTGLLSRYGKPHQE